MLNYKSNLQSNNEALNVNNLNLQSLIDQANALPDAGSVELPSLANEGSAVDLMLGKELIDADGNKITGIFTIDNELTAQDDLIAQIQAAVDNLPEAGCGEPTLQSKTVTPSTSSQTVTADSGYDGLNTVTVNAIPSTYVKPTSTKAATIYTPTTSNQTITAGTYCSGVQTIKGDSDLKAENIKSGVSIFGVSGSYEGSGVKTHGTVNITLVNTNMDNDYYIPGTWIEGGYVSGYLTTVWSNDSKVITALKYGFIIIDSTILQSISGNYASDGTVGTAKIFRLRGDCTITLK